VPFQDTVLYVRFNAVSNNTFVDSIYITASGLDPVSISLTGGAFFGISGTITQDTIICTDTLLIGSDITIIPSVTVHICAGTKVLLLGNFKITVEGGLKAEGLPGAEIEFLAADTTVRWNGIEIDSDHPDPT
jgi:hypothetical protein